MKSTLFTDLPLGRELQQALHEAAHTTPTPIQAAAIPVILEGRDLLGCAQTGTGKTAAFALPLLQQLHTQKLKTIPKAPLALVLVPTRELAAQVMESFRKYGKHLKLWQAAIYGGVNQNPQVTALRRGVHVLIATPGRLIDLLGQGHVRLDEVRTLILDEADRMLDMGFLPPLKKIIARLPEERQSLCFSATMPKEIAELVQSLLRDPHRIDIAPPATTAQTIEQQVLQVDQAGKRELLQQILKAGDAYRVLVFTRTKRRADVVARHLHQADIEAEAIHGDKSQNARTRALDRFKNGRVHVLVATDVAARGIDVEGISHVINYDLPHDPESYVHRIGRTGRNKAVGKAITFCDAAERGQLRAIERLIGIDLLPREERRSGDRPQRATRPAQGRRPVRGEQSRSGHGGGYVHRSGNGSGGDGQGNGDGNGGRPRKRRFKSGRRPDGRPTGPQTGEQSSFGAGVSEGRRPAAAGAAAQGDQRPRRRQRRPAGARRED